MRINLKLWRKNKGITLIALVVTIVVLLILAGTSIAMLSGENGIITKAQSAKEQTLIAQYKEQIDVIKADIRIEYNNEITLEILKNAFDNEEQKDWVKKTELIVDKEVEKIKLTTNDGYIFYVTENVTEYKEKDKGETSTEGDRITAEMVYFRPEDTKWNVENVQQALDYLYNN